MIDALHFFIAHAGLPPVRRSARRELVTADECLGLLAREDAFGRTHGADAARADGAGQLQAFDLGSVLEEAQDIAGVEGIAASRAIHVRDRIDPQADLQRFGDRR